MVMFMSNEITHLGVRIEALKELQITKCRELIDLLDEIEAEGDKLQILKYGAPADSEPHPMEDK